MKKYFLGIGICFSVLMVSSQELSNSGQSYLKFYKQSVAKLQKMKPGSMGFDNEIANAERKIKDIKKTDPQYNTSQMEEEIAVFKKNTKDAEEANEKTIEAKEGFRPKWDDMMQKLAENFYSAKPEEFNGIEAKVKDFEASFGYFVSREIPKGSPQEEIAIEELKQKFHNGPIEYSSNNEFLKKGEDENGMIVTYYSIRKLAYGWKVLSERFPQNQDLKVTAESAKKKFDELGSIDKLKAAAKANKAKRIAETRMTPAVTNDASAVDPVKAALKSCSYAKNRTILKVNILSSDWSIKRNDLTGIILYRYKYFEAAMKNADSSCILLKVCWYRQDYNGSGYGSGYITEGELHEILCENVNK